jgi:hypothetical protein
MLGSLALATDTINDLKRKFFGGVADGSVSPLGSLGIDYVAGKYYQAISYGGTTATAMVLNELRFAAIMIQRLHTFKSFAVDVTTGVATAVIRCGIYSDAGGIPGARLKEFGSLIDASTSGQKEIVEDTLLNPGIYWLASVAQVAAPTLNFRTNNGTGLHVANLSLSQVGVNAGAHRQQSVSGALPNPAVPDAVMVTSFPSMALKG